MKIIGPDALAFGVAAALLRAAKRPRIVAGGGVVASGAAAAVQEMAQRLRAPLMPTQMALCVIATKSPDFIGHGGLIAGVQCAMPSSAPT